MNIMINVGSQNYISSDEILIIFMPETKPIKRLISEAKENKTLIDLRIKSKLRSAILMKNGDVILISISPTTFCKRFNDQVNDLNSSCIYPIKPMLHIGNENYIPMDNLYYVETTVTGSGQRSMRSKKKTLKTYDICQESKTRAVINLTNGDIILTGTSATTISNRYNEAIIAFTKKIPYFATSALKNKNENKVEEDII